MPPGRRTVLGGLGTVGSVSLAGCLGAIDSLLDGDGDRPGYLGWLPPPGTVIPPDRYRFGSIRPPHLTDRDRVQSFLPALEETDIDPWTATRIVAGNGGYGVTASFDQHTVIETLRDTGYTYVDGVEDAWVMHHDDQSRPVYAVGTTHLAVGYPTQSADAHTVAHTLIRSQYTSPHWTATDHRTTTLIDTLGDPPILTVGHHDQRQTTAPQRGVFPDAIGWAIAEHRDPATGATIALLYPADTTPSLNPVRSWAAATFDDATLTQDGPVITVDTARPPRPWTRVPVPDTPWPMHGADPAHTAARPDTREVTPPVGVDWHYSASVNGTVTQIVADTDAAYLGVGDLLALNLGEGTRRFRIDTTVTATPAVADGVVVAPVTDGLLAVDAADGTHHWFKELPNTTVTAPVITNSTVYVGLTPATQGGLLALALSDGTRQWQTLDHPVDTAPAIHDDTLVAIDGTPTQQRTRRIHALDVTDGTPTWQTSLPGSTVYPPAIDAEHVYATTPSTMTAIDRDTHTTAWTVATPDTLSGPPTILDDYIALAESRPGATDPGTLTIHTKATGDNHLTTPLAQAAVSHPTVAGDIIVLAGAAGSLAAYDHHTGTRQWQTPPAGGLQTPTAIDDHVLVPTTAGRITSFATTWLPTPTQ